MGFYPLGTFVLAPSLEVCLGDLGQLLGLAEVKFLDIAVLVVDHPHQVLHLSLRTPHHLPTLHWGLVDRTDRGRGGPCSLSQAIQLI